MKHYDCFDSQNKDNTTFEKLSRKKKDSSAHKEKGSTSGTHKQHWRQERKNVRENKRYMGEM